MAELAGETWIQGVRRGSAVNTLSGRLPAGGFEPRVALQTDDPMAWQGLVAAGVGVTVIPQLTLVVARPDVAVRELEAPSLARRVQRRPCPAAATARRPPAAETTAAALGEIAPEVLKEASRPRARCLAVPRTQP